MHLFLARIARRPILPILFLLCVFHNRLYAYVAEKINVYLWAYIYREN